MLFILCAEDGAVSLPDWVEAVCIQPDEDELNLDIEMVTKKDPEYKNSCTCTCILHTSYYGTYEYTCIACMLL